jgi:hypothetical protein
MDVQTRRRSRWTVIVFLLVLVGLGGATLAMRRPGSLSLPPPLPTETDAPFPSETASDIVSYADHVALVTAVAEAEEPQPPIPTPTGSALPTIPRRVTFRIDRALWSRPDAPVAPVTVTAKWCGWVVQGGRRTPCAVTGTPWVFVGGQYVMPIAYDGTTFSPIQPFAVFRFNRTVALEGGQDTPLARLLAKQSLGNVASVFARAVPDPLAVQYRQLLPRARLAAVLATRMRSRE